MARFHLVAGMSFLLLACKDAERLLPPSSVATSQNLRFVEAYTVEVVEPSGLSLSKDKQSLWTISDHDSGVYQINLQGKTMARFQAAVEDLEGVTTIDANHLAFIAERARKIVVTLKDGNVLKEALIGMPGSDNQGPEALTYDESMEQFHIMQENPGVLITLNRQLEEVARRELKFAQDYSSISFDSKNKRLWVLSDQSKTIHVLNEDLSIEQTYSVKVDQMEGLAIDHEARRIYLISDPLEQLYIFEFDPF